MSTDQGYSIRPEAKKRFQSKKSTHSIRPRRSSCLLSICDWGPFGSLALLAATGSAAHAQKKYDIGATDTEIKIGNIMPYSGPASAYGVIGQDRTGYFNKINAEGGINGARSISSAMTMATARRRRSSRHASWSRRRGSVHLQFAGHAAKLGDPEIHEFEAGAAAVRRHRATKWNDPREFRDHGLAAELPERIPDLCQVYSQEHAERQDAILYQNDDYGKDYVKGLKDGLGAKAPR